MDIQLITTLISAAVTIAAFTYSLIMFIKGRRRGYFEAFCLFATFTFATGHIFTLLLETIGESSYFFNLGSLGTVSGLLCIAFACKTVQKVDEEENEADRKKHALTALAAPAYFVICWLIMLCSKLGADKMVIATLYLFSALPCAYFCLRNVITPYPKESMLRCMKPFFIVVLVYCAFMMLSEVSWLTVGMGLDDIVTIIIIAVNNICYILMPVMLHRGEKKWTTV